jgi:membrane protease subunit HflK
MNRKGRTVLVTVIINLLLVGFKFWLATASASLALRASALHSVADTIIGLFVFIGLLIGRRERANGNQAGVNIIENWVALVVAVAIFYVGFDIIREVLGKESPELRNLAVISFASILTVAVAYINARYKIYVGKQTDSPALIASGYHSQMDIYASIVVVTGLAGSALGLPNLDRAAAAVVVVFIVFSGYEIASSALHAIKHSETFHIEGGSEHSHTLFRDGNWRKFVPFAALLLLAFYVLSGFYSVQPGEIAVIRRFGKVITPNPGSGLHYRFPSPIDQIDIVAVDAVRRSETSPTLMVTGDQNLVNIRLSIQYVVDDPQAFLLNVVDPPSLVVQAGEAAMRQVVAGETVDALLTIDKNEIQEKTDQLTQSALDNYKAGIRVIGVQLLESSPPLEVADAFRDVASAREDMNTYINEALAYKNQILPEARGSATSTIQAANAFLADKIGQASGEAGIFTSQLNAYKQAPDITRLRLYLEAAETALIGARKFILDPGVNLETTDLWIPGSGAIQPLSP